MTQLVTYQADGVATIAMDDGKPNVLSPTMFVEISAALDRAEADAPVVVCTGRAGVFSAGFDLAVLRGGGARRRRCCGRVRAGRPAAVLSVPGGDRLHRPRHRHGPVPPAVG